MRNKSRESDQILQWINKTNYSFLQHKNTDASIFQRYLSGKFQKNVLMKYVIFISWIIRLHSLSFFSGKGKLFFNYSLHFRSIRRRILSYLESKTSNNSN